MSKKILLGYEIDSGKQVNIEESHIVVTGVTQKAGKTTTIMGLLKRSEKKCVIFKTKIGEKAISEGTVIPPFFKDKSDWEFVISIIEASTKQKIFIEKGTIMNLSAGTKSLLEIKRKVDDMHASGSLKGLKEEIYTRLKYYLEKVVPQIQYSNLSKTLDLQKGINVMDLERFSEEMQALIIQSTLDEILENHHDILVVLPEAWKFIPEEFGTPCKRSLESFIRQGATNGNYVWIDSQDIAGTAKIILKQVSTWILGLQTEINEVNHTLKQLPVPSKSKPKADEIMTLKKGQFYLATPEGVVKVYAKPLWLEEETAIKISKGEMNVEEISRPEIGAMLSIKPQQAEIGLSPIGGVAFEEIAELKNEMNTMRMDFFNKVQELQGYFSRLADDVFQMKSSQMVIDEDTVVAKVLQKMPMSQAGSNPSFDKNALINEILARVPKGNIVYEVAPLEKLTKDFLEEAKNRVYSDIQALSDDIKKSLKFVEVKQGQTNRKEIYNNGLGFAGGYAGGGSFDKGITELINKALIKKDVKGRLYPNLKERIKAECQNFGITDAEIGQVYSHILMEMLK